MSTPRNASDVPQRYNIRVFYSRDEVEAHYQLTSPEYVSDLMKLHDDMHEAALAALQGRTPP